MPTLLDDALVTDTLLSLPGWEGTHERIWRDVQLTPDQDAELRKRVAVAAGSMGHDPLVEDQATGTRFVLWTHSKGGVTELDISLASRISDLVRIIGGGQGVEAVRPGPPVVLHRSHGESEEPADGSDDPSEPPPDQP